MTSIKSPYYISSEIKRQLDNSRRIVTQADQDRIFIVTGREGSGKSWLAMQLAGYLDSTLCLDDICFDAESFGNRIKEVKKNKAIIFDEAFSGLSSKGALSKENKKLIKILIECRQRNLYLFIVLPSIFILDRYIALFRSHGLFNTAISKKDFKNRFYKVYNFRNKHLLYILGQKYLSYSKPKIWKKHRFYGKLPPTIKEEDYKKKKSDSFREKEKEEVTEYRKLMIQRNISIVNLKQKTKMTNVGISKMLEEANAPLTAMNVGRILQNHLKTNNNE